MAAPGDEFRAGEQEALLEAGDLVDAVDMLRAASTSATESSRQIV
jgi:hypothetical protein